MTAWVLVVDDLLPNLNLLEAQLSAEYLEVLTATNGAGEGMEPGGMIDENRSRRVCAKKPVQAVQLRGSISPDHNSTIVFLICTRGKISTSFDAMT